MGTVTLLSLLHRPVNLALSLHLMEHIKKPAITVPLRHCRHIGKIIDMSWIVTVLLHVGVDLVEQIRQRRIVVGTRRADDDQHLE